MVLVYDVVRARGHGNIRATHETTLEITREDYVTPRGDCIIACMADKAVADLSPELKKVLQSDDTFVIVVLRVRDLQDFVLCQGSSRLTLSNPRKIIIRKSTYVDDATLCIRANKAARDIDRRIVNYLCTGEEVEVRIYAARLSEVEKFLSTFRSHMA